jgi:hypothetical protein
MKDAHKRFAVVVRYNSENIDNQYMPDVYWHKAPKAAARRLAALINGKAAWVPKRTRVGTRFYIVDHNQPYSSPDRTRSLTEFKKAFGV